MTKNEQYEHNEDRHDCVHVRVRRLVDGKVFEEFIDTLSDKVQWVLDDIALASYQKGKRFAYIIR